MEIPSTHVGGHGLNLPFGATIESIVPRLPELLRGPRVGIVCGSGLSGLVESLRETVLIPYETLPGFAKSTGRFIVFRCSSGVVNVGVIISGWTQKCLSVWTDGGRRRCSGSGNAWKS